MVRSGIAPILLLLASALSGPAAVAQEDPCTAPPQGSAAQVEPVVVCGTTVVSGPAGATIRLAVPTDTVLNLGPDRGRWVHARAEGVGPFAGFLLTDNTLESQGGAFVIGLHLADGYWSIVPDWSVSTLEQVTEGRYLVPAGSYSLYLLAPNGTVSVTLPFESRQGEASVTADRVTEASVEILRSVVPDPAGADQQHVASQGKSGSLGLAGFLGLYVSVIEPEGAVPEYGNICLYNGLPSHAETAYWPGCPAQHIDGMQGWSYPPPGRWPPTQQHMVYGILDGDWALGHWWTAMSPALRVAAISIFVPYDDAVAGDAPSPQAVPDEVARGVQPGDSPLRSVALHP